MRLVADSHPDEFGISSTELSANKAGTDIPRKCAYSSAGTEMSPRYRSPIKRLASELLRPDLGSAIVTVAAVFTAGS